MVEKQTFLAILLAMPQLTVLHLELTHHYSKFLLMLQDTNDVYLKKIRTIKTPNMDGDDQHETHCKIFYQFRKTLTEIETTIPTLKGLEQLIHFDNLTKICLYNRYGQEMIILPIVFGYPKLIDFEFSSDFEIPRYANNTLDSLSFKAENEGSICNQKLKSLRLTLPSLTTAHVRYITDYAPKTLENVSITMSVASLFFCITQCGVDKILGLTKRLSLLPDIRIFANELNRSPIKDLGEEIELAVIHRFIKALIGNRQLYCEAN